MKIAIYTIALNEELNAKKFMEAHKNADLVVVGDTGSTDRTTEIIQDNGGAVVPLRVLPFRFNTARNALLALLPEDIDLCIAVDLDETLQPGWRTLIEESWKPQEHNRLRFRYVHHYHADGTEGTTGMKDFAHARANYTWNHAVHEQLYYLGKNKENVLTLPNLTVGHRQIKKTSRASYVPLMEFECTHGQPSSQHYFWLAREYALKKEWASATQWLKEFLSLESIWYIEKAHALIMLAKACAATGNAAEARMLYLQAVECAPKERETWYQLAFYHDGLGDSALAYYACIQALRITQRPEHYLSGDSAWDHRIYSMAAKCAFYMKLLPEAQEHIKTALRMSPSDEYVLALAEKLQVKQDN